MVLTHGDGHVYWENDDDKPLIVEMRNALPELLDELERLRKENESLDACNVAMLEDLTQMMKYNKDLRECNAFMTTELFNLSNKDDQ